MIKPVYYLTFAILLSSNLLVNAQNLLNAPESIVFDEDRERYLLGRIS